MKILLTLIALAFASTALADTWVNPYSRRDGTEVQGHWRSNPNTRRDDNWSTWPNVNPYTGEQGSRRFDGYSPSHQYDPYRHQPSETDRLYRRGYR